jgi:hypothetical protein
MLLTFSSLNKLNPRGYIINLDKPKQRYIRLLENALFGFGLFKLGLMKQEETYLYFWFVQPDD